MFAFIGSLLVQLEEFMRVKDSDIGRPFPSGLGYWPMTVSESVGDRNSAAGKIFFTGCLISSLALFLSWYPYNLRNVYSGPEFFPCSPMYVCTVRQYLVPIGVLVLAGVSIWPTQAYVQDNKFGGQICLAIHLAGAGAMFVGYMLSEFICMELCGFKHAEAAELAKSFDPESSRSIEWQNKSYLSIEGTERIWRTITISCMAFFFAMFIVFQGLLMIPTCGDIAVKPNCYDDWMQRGEWFNRTDRNGHIHEEMLDKAVVTNTASGMYLFFKMGSYFSECLAGIFLILSHYVIFWYCEERQVSYGDSQLEIVYFDEDQDEDEETLAMMTQIDSLAGGTQRSKSGL
jgi:hypothetical protein